MLSPGNRVLPSRDQNKQEGEPILELGIASGRLFYSVYTTGGYIDRAPQTVLSA